MKQRRSPSWHLLSRNLGGALVVSAITGLASISQIAMSINGPLTCPANLSAYWMLDESSGLAYADASGRGHTANCADGECPLPVAGVVGGAQQFTTSTYVNVASHTDFNWGVDDSFSIEFWMQTDAASSCTGNQVILGRDVPGNQDLHWWLGCQSPGQSTFFVRDWDEVEGSVSATTDVSDGSWHHVVGVRDAVADELRVYVDGGLAATDPVTYTAGFASPTALVNIGWIDAFLDYHFQGLIDELAVYAAALTETEIGEHISANQAGRGVCEQAPPPTPTDTPVPGLTEKLFLPLVQK